MKKKVNNQLLGMPDKIGEEDDEEGDYIVEDNSSIPMSGKNKFDVLLKSMIARIEFNNCLAPVQNYGRHQQKGAAKKKKTKKVVVPGAEHELDPNSESAKLDDNFYDLDDDFIDDDDIDQNMQDEVVSDLLEMSRPPDEDLEEGEGEHEDPNEEGSGSESSEMGEDELQDLEQQKYYKRMLAKF